MPGKYDPEVTASRYLDLENQMIWNLWILRDMIQHRSIDRESLAKESGFSTRTVSDLLSGSIGSKWKPDVYLAKLAKLEDAITTITDRRGGIPEACCGVTGITKSVLSIHDGRYRP